MGGPCIEACGGEVYKVIYHVNSKENMKIEKEPKMIADWKTTPLDQSLCLIVLYS